MSDNNEPDYKDLLPGVEWQTDRRPTMGDDKVKRWNIFTGVMNEAADGEYVDHEDYAKMEENLLESEKRHAVEIKINNQLEAEISVLKGKLTVYMSNDIAIQKLLACEGANMLLQDQCVRLDAENARLKALMEKTKVLIESRHSLNNSDNIRAVESAIDAIEEGK